ncbi:acyltransferase domain-containing protein [Enterococcus hirae]
MTPSIITVEKLMEMIELPKEVQQELTQVILQLKENELITSGKRLLEVTKAEKEAKRLSEVYQGETIKELAFHLYAACMSWESVYLPRQISFEIYQETMHAFTRFLEESKRINHFYQFDRGFWTWRYVCGLEFRINQLEFEMVAPPHKNKVPELADKSYISIHIPSDADLTHPLITETYLEAQIFIDKYYPDYRTALFITDTWLLSPKLKEWLKPEANLSLFADDYQLLLTELNKNEGVFWIFNTISSDVTSYPEKTSLQRAAKKEMLQGGHIGSAVGILVY